MTLHLPRIVYHHVLLLCVDATSVVVTNTHALLVSLSVSLLAALGAIAV
jgi:hypothetical protein